MKWKGLALFGVMMIVFTLLSRAAVTVTTPVVEVVQPKEGALEYSLKAAGIVKENQVQAVSVTPGIRVADISVNKGDNVTAGAPLFVLDTADLQEQILQKKLELEKLELGISDIKARKASEQEKREREQIRAQEDYNRVVQMGDEAVQRAAEEMDAALWVLEEFRSMQNSDFAMSDDQQEQTLADTYQQAKKAYDDALNERERSILEAERKVEDSLISIPSDSTDRVSEIDRQVLETQLEKLEDLLNQQGVIFSPIEGKIMEIGVETGNDTMDGRCMAIADLSMGSRFVAQISKEQHKLVNRGDEIMLDPGNGEKKLEGLLVESVRENEEEKELLDVTVLISDNSLEIGSSAILQLQKKSADYPCIIPVEALYFDKNTCYVLVLRETETVLGTEWTAGRVEVSLVEKNEKKAALGEGVLTSKDRIIVSSSKPVKEGDRVCQREEQEK